PDGRRLGKVITTTGLVLDLEEEPTRTINGKLTPGSTRLRLTPESDLRHWEQRIVKKYPQLKLKTVSLKPDSEGSWSGTAMDERGKRYSVWIRPGPGGRGRERHYAAQVLPLEGE